MSIVAPVERSGGVGPGHDLGATAPARRTPAAPSRSTAPRDGAALLVGLVFLGLALLVGFRAAAGQTWDVDERAFHDTLVSMHHGEGPYAALRDALITKEGAAPSNVRAYRLPTLAWLQALVPVGSLRWLVAIPFATMLWAAWRIGRPHGPWGGTASVALVGFWIVGASPLLYLHHEIWAAPLLLAGLAVVDRRPRLAAVLLGGAVAIRELFAATFVAGLALHRRSRTWWAVTGVLAAGGIAHVIVASRYLDPDGVQPALAWDGFQLGSIGPAGSIAGAVLGVVGGGLGLLGAAALARRGSKAGRIAVVHGVLAMVATIAVGRTYWGYSWGPALACFAPAGWAALRGRLAGGPASLSPAPAS